MESLRKIKELDKKRKAALLDLLGGSRKCLFLKEKQRATSSSQAAANLSDRPSTSRQGDTLTVSNNSDRMRTSSHDADLVTAANVTSSHEAIHSQGQINVTNEIEANIASDVLPAETANKDLEKAIIVRAPPSIEGHTSMPTSSGTCLEETAPNPDAKEDDKSEDDVLNVSSYAKEAVAQVQADFEKSSTGEGVVLDQNTQGSDFVGSYPSFCQQPAPIAVCHPDPIDSVTVTESTISTIDNRCAGPLNQQWQVPVVSCIGLTTCL